MVVGLCRFLLRDPVEAEDAAQQSFVAAHHSLLRGSIPRDAPAWLATIARNECRARIRQRMREPLALPEPDGAEGQLPDPFQTAVENADLEALRAGLEALPASQRNAFVLREFAGLSYNELARALEVTEPAVESLLVRARTRLRLALSYANPLVLSVVLRDQLVRLTTSWDDGSVGGVAKIASLPFAAKLAAAGTGAVLVVAGGAGVERLGDGHRATPADRASGVTHATTVVVHQAVVHSTPDSPAAAVTRLHDDRLSQDLHGAAVRGDAVSGQARARSGPFGGDVSGRSRDGASRPTSGGEMQSGDDAASSPVLPTSGGSSGSNDDVASALNEHGVSGAQAPPVQPVTSSSGPGDGGTSVSGGAESGGDGMDGSSGDGHGSGGGSSDAGSGSGTTSGGS
jgi:RNA polymerase sigma factor (sigma-70 family)